jgi:hypothetical protein
MQPTGFAGQVRIDVVHEPGQLLGVLNCQKKVVVIRQEDEGMELD